jgi:hypothetical protein
MTSRSPRPTRLREPLAWVGALGVCAASAALIALFGRWLGPGSALFALEFHFVGMACAVYVDKLLAPRLDGRRFEVSAGEARAYRARGALAFLRLQRASGWEAALCAGQRFEMRRATLRDYEHATREGENAHAILLLITAVVSLAEVALGVPQAAPWLLGQAVVFHDYPVMLQRTQRERLQPLLARLQRRSSSQGQSSMPRDGTCRR